jgi:hypothetical protein
MLTAAHVREAYAKLAADFVMRPVPETGPTLRSSIVLLERIDA